MASIADVYSIQSMHVNRLLLKNDIHIRAMQSTKNVNIVFFIVTAMF